MILAIIIAFMIGGGTTFMAQNALPGDFLYPVKIEVNETIKSLIVFDADTEAKLQADFLAERVEEMEILQARGILTTKQASVIADRVRAQSNQVYEASEASSPEIAATTLAQAKTSLRQYNMLVADNAALIINIETNLPVQDTDDGIIYPSTDTRPIQIPPIDCSQVPVTTGPESLQWQAVCGNEAVIDSKVDGGTRINSEEMVFDCSTPPSTMGPESLLWQAACGGVEDGQKVR